MNELEMQELQNRVVESIQGYFDAYDWDAKFIERFGEQGVESLGRAICQSPSVVCLT